MKKKLTLISLLLVGLFAGLLWAAQLNELTLDSAPAENDLLYLLKSPYTSGSDRKIYFGSLSSVMGAVNVKDPKFGAKGDGVTDDTAAIQAAINSLPDGGIVFLPIGKYVISALTVPQLLPITIKGAGASYATGAGTELVTNLASGYVFDLDDNILGFRLENFRMTGNATADGFLRYDRTTGYAFNWTFRDLYIDNFSKAGYRAFKLTDPSHILMEHIIVESGSSGVGYGLEIIGSTLDTGVMTFINCLWGLNVPLQYGLKILESGISVTNNLFIGNLFKATEACVDLEGGRLTTILNSSCEYHKLNGSAIVIRYGQSISILGSSIYGIYTGVEALYGIDFTDAGYTTNVTIDNLNVTLKSALNGGYAIRVQGGTNIQSGTIEVGKIICQEVTPAASDFCYVISDASHKVRCKHDYTWMTSTWNQVASAATLTLPSNGDFFVVTGTTNIDNINMSYTGRIVTLMFQGILTLADSGNQKIEGAFTTSADDTITLRCDGTSWVQVSRSVN